MTALLLFIATFAAVFTLGVQQINVERRHMLAAAATSPLIGLAHLALFKVLPGPTLAIEIAAYLAGGSAGIVASIWAHPRMAAALGALRRARTPAGATSAHHDPGAAAELQAHAERLGETLRMATHIADYSARSDIESACSFERDDGYTWFDIARTAYMSPEEYGFISAAVRYLSLRGHITRHPDQPHLVRFITAPCNE